MATYTIIGGDGKEYGPVSDAEVRKWIAEGRLNAQSLMKAESDAEFRTLDKFPEFADVFNNPATSIYPPVISPGAGGDDFARSAALQAIKPPAVALIVLAIINILLSLWNVIKLSFFPPDLERELAKYPQLQDPQIQHIFQLFYGPIGIGSAIFTLVMGVVILFGALKMKNLKSYEFAFTAAILALLPCVSACCLLGLPLGIWALVVMNKPQVKSQFK
ncbi:MAG TPA: DUF4339 domain-containing protein [Verrucomicrobiae bacterium]|nr:DUF4339 domain-containing protein [Verrucomicrobiae bacterium]